MKKRGFLFALFCVAGMLLVGCRLLPSDPTPTPAPEHTHTGGHATCTSRAVCEICGIAYGEIDPDAHEWEASASTDREATCTEEGLRSVKCVHCHTVKEGSAEVIPAVGHKGGTATCTSRAVCTVCHEEYGEINPNGHILDDFRTTDRAATCTMAGSSSIHCSLCGEKFNVQAISPLGHRFEHYVYNGDADATHGGTMTAHCERAGCTATDTKADPDHPAPTHEHSGGVATCMHGAICEICHEEYGEPDPDNHEYEEGYTVDTPATCQSAGEESHHCVNPNCTAKTGARTVAKLTHSFTNYVYNGDAACERDGTKTAHCDHDGCTATDTKADPDHKRTGHSFTEYVYNEDACCTQSGTMTAHCDRERCHATDTKNDPDHPKLGHSFTNYVYNGDGTCEKDGTMTAHCDRDGCTAADTKADPAHVHPGHSFTNYVYNGDATCQKAGTKTAHCDHSGCTAADIKADPSHPQTDHRYEYGKCVYCEGKDPNWSEPDNVFEPKATNLFSPSADAFKAGVVYDWDPDNMTMSTINVAKFANLKTSVKAAVANTPALADSPYIAVMTGAFPIQGLVYKVGYQYSISVTYYAPDYYNVPFHVASSAAGGNYTIQESVLSAGIHTLNLTYTVKSGDYQLYLYYPAVCEVYFGKMEIELAENGPTMSQLKQEGGFTWDLSHLQIGGGGSLTTVGKLSSTLKTQAKNAGYTDDTPIFAATSGGSISGLNKAAMFVPGYRYEITIEYVSGSTGGYLIALDSTYGNHAFTGGDAFKSGYHKETYVWTVGANGEYDVVTYSAPTVYILSMNIKLVCYSEEDMLETRGPEKHTLSRDELHAGYTYTFNEGSVPALSGGTMWVQRDGLTQPSRISAVTASHGFGAYGLAVKNSSPTFDFLSNCLMEGKVYHVTVTLCAESAPSIWILQMDASTGRQSTEGDSVSKPSSTNPYTNVYVYTYTVTALPNVGSLLLYATTSCDYIIGAIRVQADNPYIAHTQSESAPEWGSVADNNPTVSSPASKSLSEIIQSLYQSGAYTANVTGSGIGLSNAADVGMVEAYLDDVLYPVPANAQFAHIYNAYDYGIRTTNTGKENSAALALLLRELRSVSGLKRLYFHEGVYRFAGTLTFTDINDLYVCSATASERFTIMMTEWVQGIQATNCTNLHFNNFNFRYENQTVVTGTVVSYASNTLVLQIDEGFDLTAPMYNGGSIVNNWSVVGYRDITPTAYTAGYTPVSNALAYGGAAEISGSYDKVTGRLTIKFKNPSSVVYCGTPVYTNGMHVSVAYTMYEYFGMYLTSCTDTYLEGVNLWQTGGMAIGSAYCRNIYMNALHLSPEEKDSYMMTATADGFHPVATTGEILITNSIFELSHDDAMNIKNVYLNVVANDAKKITYNGSSSTPMQVGDTIAVYRLNDYSLVGKYTVAAFDTQACSITTRERLPANIAGCLVADITSCSTLTVRNTFIGNKRNRGMLIQTRGVLLENCTFQNIIHGPIQIESRYDSFTEGIMPGDLTIKDCKFINNSCTDVLVETYGRSGTVSSSIENVRVTNCFFYGTGSSYFIYSRGGNGVEIDHNLFANGNGQLKQENSKSVSSHDNKESK